ncbi:DEAD/DEAH box helicase [Pseudolysinimonas kribbensis]
MRARRTPSIPEVLIRTLPHATRPHATQPPATLLQATYVPAENGLAWWGVADIDAALEHAGLPPGRRAALRLAGIVGDRVGPIDVEARITAVAEAASALTATTRVGALGMSARAWRQASRIVLRSARSGSEEDAFAAVVAAMPPAGHAVLNADESAIAAPGALVREYARALSTLKALRAANVTATLRPYQVHGVSWLLQKVDAGQGGVLADEMGLGKTLQVIAVLATRQPQSLQLVVCPTSLLANWRREIQHFAPGLNVLEYHGPDRRLPARPEPRTVVVTSYALLRSDEAVRSRHWDVAVFDEAQQLKNTDTQVTRAASALPSTSRIALTGTPVENDLDELWSILSVTNPGALGARGRFRQRFVNPIRQRRSASAAATLATVVAPHLLRRRKADVAQDLPPRIDATVVCTLSPEQVALYREAVERAFSAGLGSGFGRSGRVLALLTELKQICNHPALEAGEPALEPGRSGKFDRTCEMLGEVVADGERALVFTQYRRTGELLSSGLASALRIDAVPFLHGGLAPAQRDELIRAFQEDDHASPLLILSLRAAGFGLNLTRASNVVHFDRWWNPAVEEQATARAHRIGQRRTLNVYKLVTEGTVEDYIDRMHQEKQGLAELISGDPTAALTKLPDRELREVLDLRMRP